MTLRELNKYERDLIRVENTKKGLTISILETGDDKKFHKRLLLDASRVKEDCIIEVKNSQDSQYVVIYNEAKAYFEIKKRVINK